MDKKYEYNSPLVYQRADPFVYLHTDGYCYFTGTMPQYDCIEIRRAKTLNGLLTADSEVVWKKHPTGEMGSHIWAPELHFWKGKWYIYYAADDGNTDNHQMYVLENVNRDPFDGEFVMKGRISTDKDNNWAIDGSVFQNKGELYMVWSGWQTRRVDTETQCIYIARMENPWTLGSERVLISKPELEWERHHKNENGWNPSYDIFVNEGPQPLLSPKGKYVHIAYSASGVWTPYYALGMLTASTDSDMLDPKSWSKSQQPVFKQSPENGVYGTGHNSFFPSPDGTEWYILYHARDTQVDPEGAGDTRSPRAQKFVWLENDYPDFGTPLPTTARLNKPSGIVTTSAK